VQGWQFIKLRSRAHPSKKQTHETEDCACWRTCCALKTLNIEAQPRSSTKCMCFVVFAHHLKQTYTNRTAWLRGAGCLQCSMSALNDFLCYTCLVSLGCLGRVVSKNSFGKLLFIFLTSFALETIEHYFPIS